MIINNTNNYDSPVRLLKARVELFSGSALADTYNQNDRIKEFTIERVGESKFFGYGICQKFNIHLIDKDRSINITTANSFNVSLSTGGDYINSFPDFYVTETHRDENTNELSITAYDAIYKSSAVYVSELVVETPYTIRDFSAACANALGVGLLIAADAAESFNLSFDTGANFEGTETIREALDDIAEATQTIYFIDNENRLVFKRLDLNGDPVFTIDREKYITLSSKDNRRLQTISNVSELGDNVSASISAIGSTQYIRGNAFWSLREDIATLLDAALLNVGGLSINQFECEWRGNPLLELGDKIGLETKDNGLVTSFLLDDTIYFDGSLIQNSQWYYDDSEETESNPASLGDALKQTFARVDKVNKQIDLVVSKTEENTELLTNLQLTTDNITASVGKIETNVNTTLDSINSDLSTLSSKVEASITAEDVSIAIQSELSNGVDKVTTSTGFTFNENGLTVNKSGSEMETTITEDGMTVYRDAEAVLTANNIGVNATNLHATTYLIVGNNSRFEDFGSDRTGCFWIGG